MIFISRGLLVFIVFSHTETTAPHNRPQHTSQKALTDNYANYSRPVVLTILYPHRIMAGMGYFKAWESMLEESDRQARSYTDLSQRLITSVSQQLNELTNRKKNLMKKVSEPQLACVLFVLVARGEGVKYTLKPLRRGQLGRNIKSRHSVPY